MKTKSAEIAQERIDACNTLIDYVLDDIPHSKQQPLLDELRSLSSDFQSDLESEIAERMDADEWQRRSENNLTYLEQKGG